MKFPKRTYLFHFIVVLSCLLLSIAERAFWARLSFGQIFRQLIETSFLCGTNFCAPGLIGGLDSNIFWIRMALVSFFIALISIYAQRSKRHDKGLVQKMFVSTLAWVYLFIIGFQLLGMKHDFQQTVRDYGGKSLPEKLTQIHDGYYHYAMAVRKFLPGIHRAKLVTDLDMENDSRGMTIHRILAYHLYPVDIRGIIPGEPDVLVFFMAKDANNQVPADFRVLKRYDDQNMIAVKNTEK